ncbi:MAG TPA: N-acetylgalactosamine 6-sulfate sulfatase [Planctomycetes bacterium]|nr:N-acetylgalactosamine 6-sulfate sulfatase [Verrucomicrobiales bacterium]HIM30956.1 N-acetylgalactosamine 6-sulfate sulfatase [Planctomycetota bacterium]
MSKQMKYIHAMVASWLLMFCQGSVLADDGSVLPTSARPNIILIMVDDMGRDWVSCYGSPHQTPCVDRLAKQGLRYETAWSMPICTPTRVTLLTGQYPFRHGWTTHYDVPRQGGVGLDWNQFTTFARVLRNAGYATGIGGKWQINDLRRQKDALWQHGFDEHAVWTGAEKGHEETEKRYFDGYVMTNNQRKTVPYGPDAINNFAIEFVKRHRDRPFLFYYPMLLAHGPYGSTPLNQKNAPVEKPEQYAGYVTYMDYLVGRLVDAVDEAGIADRTMIVFTGDNGSSTVGALHGSPYKKGKGQRADWGVHVPLVVRAPFLIPQAGLTSNDLVDFTDFYPTFVELAGGKLPDGIQIDGKSLLPSLSGDEDPFKKRNWIYSQIGDFRMVRDWQFSLDNQGGCYRLSDDPLQKNNLFTSQERIIPGRRDRLKMILDRFPVDAKRPFDSAQGRTASD